MYYEYTNIIIHTSDNNILKMKLTSRLGDSAWCAVLSNALKGHNVVSQTEYHSMEGFEGRVVCVRLNENILGGRTLINKIETIVLERTGCCGTQFL